MKKVLAPMFVIIVLLLAPVLAIGASLTGSIQGFNCVTQGKLCPVGKEDPVLAVESVFVLLVDAAKQDYYIITNADRGVLARRFNQEVKIDGTVNAKAKSISATDLYTMDKNKKWQKVWSENKLDPIYRDMWNPSQGGQ
jgi:hypothetical protein